MLQLRPLIDDNAVRKVVTPLPWAENAPHRQAPGRSWWMLVEPAVLTGVTPAMTISREETFWSVAPLFRFKTKGYN